MLLNLDAGEHDTEPEELWALADILAVACGGHAGDAASMARLVRFCSASGVELGAHPSYPDKEGFGRRTIAIDPVALQASVTQQCRALVEAARTEKIEVRYVKPHGALYHDAARDPVLAAALIDGARAALGDSFALIGPPSADGRTALATIAQARGIRSLREGFADRATKPDGSLVPRGEPGALITDALEAVARTRALAGHVEVICVHSDTPGALVVARAVRTVLDAAE